jgi:tRNA(Arg) A34 adenosine deaminase TadA
MDPDERFLRLAIEKALEGIAKGQTPFGACIVRGGEVISCEHNVVWAEMDITAHAEIHAIRRACAALRTVDLSGCTVYSTCEPCPMCFSACHWARVERIVFGASIRDAELYGFNELPVGNVELKHLGRSPVKIRSGVLPSACLELFRLWSQQGSRRAY